MLSTIVYLVTCVVRSALPEGLEEVLQQLSAEHKIGRGFAPRGCGLQPEQCLAGTLSRSVQRLHLCSSLQPPAVLFRPEGVHQGFPADLSKQKTILTVSTRSRSGLLHPFPPKSLTFCPSLGGLQAPSRNILANVANLRGGQVLICNDPRASCPSAFTDISLSKIDVDAAHSPVLTLHLGPFNLCHFQPL